MLHHHMETLYPSRQKALRYTSLECFHMALVSPGMSRLTLPFTVRSDLTSYTICKHTNYVLPPPAIVATLMCLHMVGAPGLEPG